MGLLKELQSLFQETHTHQPDESWPKETEGYYEDTSVPRIYEPPTSGLTDTWMPTADQVIPYRGVEDHGVPYDATKQYIIPVSPVDDEPKEPSVEVATETAIDPIPVSVVAMPEPHSREHRIATAKTLVSFNATSPTAVQIVPKSYRRSIVTLAVTGNDTVWIATDKQSVTSTGFPIVAAMGKLELHTTDPVYAYAPTADSTVYVLEEYTISGHEHVV